MPETRSRSGSVQIEDMKELLQQLESRLSLQISKVFEKVESLEKSIDAIKANQVRLDVEVNNLKQIVLNQQKQIEKREIERRINNVVIQGIPESNVTVDDESLSNDEEKILHLMEIAGVADPAPDSIESLSRLGKKLPNKNRSLLVRFDCKKDKDRFLFQQKRFRSSKSCVDNFGTIFVNRDSTFLMRKEQKRLRDKMKDLRNSSSGGNDRIFIKSDKLYHNDKIVDTVDISNQLF